MKPRDDGVAANYSVGASKLARAIGKYLGDYQANPRWINRRHLRGEGRLRSSKQRSLGWLEKNTV